MSWFTRVLLILGVVMLFIIISSLLALIIAIITGDFAVETTYTNGDRIREMSDAELADFLTDVAYENANPKKLPVKKRSECQKLFVNWLRKKY